MKDSFRSIAQENRGHRQLADVGGQWASFEVGPAPRCYATEPATEPVPFKNPVCSSRDPRSTFQDAIGGFRGRQVPPIRPRRAETHVADQGIVKAPDDRRGATGSN